MTTRNSSSASPQFVQDLQERIRRRAEEIYLESGRVEGRDLANWSQAEHEIMNEIAHPAGRVPAVVVRVGGVQYVGEYTPESSEGYKPGEFGPGASVPVRFAGDKMFVTRPNGKELETTIVRKTR